LLPNTNSLKKKKKKINELSSLPKHAHKFGLGKFWRVFCKNKKIKKYFVNKIKLKMKENVPPWRRNRHRAGGDLVASDAISLVSVWLTCPIFLLSRLQVKAQVPTFKKWNLAVKLKHVI
jgi:hypothetical protein